MHVGSIWSHFCFRLWHRSHDVVLDFLAPGPEGDIDLFMGVFVDLTGASECVCVAGATGSCELSCVVVVVPCAGRCVVCVVYW